MEKQVTVATFDETAMAYIARSKLEASGIPCYLANEHLVGMVCYYANAVHGIDLKVHESDAALARELLTEELSPGDITPEIRELAPDLDTALFEPETVCPRCGSGDVRRISFGRLSLYLAFLLGAIPLRWRSRPCTCKACGHKWREKP